MRIAVVSDIHGNLPALQAVVRDLEQRAVHRVINLGDSLSGPLQPGETADFLMAQPWVHLAGNHERQILSGGQRLASDEFARARLTPAQLAWLATLQHSVALNEDVYLCHGTPASDVEYFLETVEVSGVRAATRAEIDARLAGVCAPLVLCGHTHVPRGVRSTAGQLIVNPGSVGLPAYDSDWPYPHRMETGSPDARYAIVEQRHGRWLATHVAVPYDHLDMARLAQARAREDWATALATGYASRGAS